MMRVAKSKFGCNPAIAFPLAIFVCSLLVFLSIFMLPFAIHDTHTRSDDQAQHNNFSRRRTELYANMATDLEKHGAKFLSRGTTSQSLILSDIFSFKDGNVQPILKPADPAVRATVLYLEPQYAEPISAIVKRILGPHFPTGVWFQDPNLYHFSLLHASHHLDPVVATPAEVENVAKRCCQLSIVLEKVLLTSTGVLLGCWQVVNGTDPAVIRRELKKALPRSPTKQLYDEVMLHTSFARLLGPPEEAGKVLADIANDTDNVFEWLVAELNKGLQNYEALVKELWFVEELDVLALALKGRIQCQRFLLQCLKGQQ